MVNVSPLARMLRALLAVAVACSWLLLTGLPATAAITDSSVESPQDQAKLAESQPLVVAVKRTPEEKPGTVCTQLFLGSAPTSGEPSPSEEPSVERECKVRKDADDQPVGTVVELDVLERTTDSGEEIVRFGGVNIDPYSLVWLGGAVADNGEYTVRYTAVGEVNQHEGSVGFILDAPPPAQAAPEATVVGKAKHKQIDVAWQANAAPDLTGYTVDRRRGDGEWRSVADVGARVRKITDTVDKYGSYQYRVTAVRPTWDAKGTHATTSEASGSVVLEPPPEPAPPAPSEDAATERPTESETDDDGSNDTPTPPSYSGGYPSVSAGPVSGGLVAPPDSQDPVVAMPRNYDDTYKGPLKYNVQQEEVTERVPIDIARGGVTEDGGILTVLDRAVDRERMLPPVAGGLILVLSAAHVLRYLNE